MLKRAISVATIILVILGVGILLAKASPRVDRYKVGNKRVGVEGNNTFGLALMGRRFDLHQEVDNHVKVDFQNVRFLNERVQKGVTRELLDRFVGNEVNTLRGSVEDDVPALLNRRNLDARLEHLSVDNLAVYNLRACAPRQLENVLSGQRLVDLQRFPVFGKLEVLKQLEATESPAALTLTPFQMAHVEALRHDVVAKLNLLVQTGRVNVTERLDELDLADV